MEKRIDSWVSRTCSDRACSKQQSIRKATYFYQFSATQGGAVAQSNLGSLMQLGKGMKKDRAKALHLIRQSAIGGAGRRATRQGNSVPVCALSRDKLRADLTISPRKL